MTTHTARSRIMYGADAEARKGATKQQPPLSRAQAGDRLYKKGNDTGFSHDWALASYCDRRAASLRDDPERLQESRTERRQLHALAEKYGVTPAALHEGLMALREHEQNPRKPETTQERFKEAFEQLRLEEGSTQKATQLWERFQKGAAVFASACPSMAVRVESTGVAADPRAMRFLASLATEPTEPPEA